ncbi:DUF5316 family protein [Virgibacillus siamensis]|uniref:DUF5316 family protein n=1 Tax=Virgibacillus siamensis TaxID=480071 RepID=UPI000986F556|nr:DUF5316 family protein [Virgibacillus siamensis]
MKRALGISVITAAVLFLVGFISGNHDLFGKIAVGIGVFFLLVSGLTSGLFVSGRQMQANFHTESKADRAGRRNMMFISSIIMIPHFICGYFLLIL